MLIRRYFYDATGYRLRCYML